VSKHLAADTVEPEFATPDRSGKFDPFGAVAVANLAPKGFFAAQIDVTFFEKPLGDPCADHSVSGTAARAVGQRQGDALGL